MEARRALTANEFLLTKKSKSFILSAKDLINNQFVLLQSGKKLFCS
jgi:tyrosyl-tRNA synthetase